MLLLLFFGSPVAAAPSRLPTHEVLQYTVEWRLVTAGKARVEWSATHHSAPGWQADLHLESVGLVSKLFKVNNEYTSNLAQDLCATGSYLKSEEGKRHKETRVTFNQQARKAEYLETDLDRKAVSARDEIDTPACVHDVLGGLYVLRTLDLQPGQKTQVPVSDGKRSVMARVEAQQREDVKTPAGSFKTIRYEAFLFNNVLYRRYGHLHVWLTDDARKLPVQIRVRLQFAIGTITLQLEKEEKT
jgi:Protein of unknown function (DUF3108)